MIPKTSCHTIPQILWSRFRASHSLAHSGSGPKNIQTNISHGSLTCRVVSWEGSIKLNNVKPLSCYYRIQPEKKPREMKPLWERGRLDASENLHGTEEPRMCRKHVAKANKSTNTSKVLNTVDRQKNTRSWSGKYHISFYSRILNRSTLHKSA